MALSRPGYESKVFEAWTAWKPWFSWFFRFWSPRAPQVGCNSGCRSRATGKIQTWDYHQTIRNTLEYAGKICGAKTNLQNLRKLRKTSRNKEIVNLIKNRQLAPPWPRITLKEHHLKVKALRVMKHCGRAQHPWLRKPCSRSLDGLKTMIFMIFLILVTWGTPGWLQFLMSISSYR